MINAGGNVLAGDKYNGDYYKIGVQDPSKNGISYVINTTNVSVVTSGGYERNYVYNGITYHHIISPITLFPTSYMESVTVVTPSSAMAVSLAYYATTYAFSIKRRAWMFDVAVIVAVVMGVMMNF